MNSIFSDPLWFALAAVNILIVFLMMLNGYLRGRFKQHIDAVLGVLIVALFVTVLLIYSWPMLLGHILGSLIVGALVQPLAARIASKLLDERHHTK